VSDLRERRCRYSDRLPFRSDRSVYIDRRYATTRDQYFGYGVPNAGASVSAAIAATNRLTPLFALYSSTAGDYMYTTGPQAAISAVKGLLPPRVNDTAIPYTTAGATINEYSAFPVLYPNGEPAPRAQVWVFTTDKNPFSTSVPLTPIYRLSYCCVVGTRCAPPQPNKSTACSDVGRFCFRSGLRRGYAGSGFAYFSRSRARHRQPYAGTCRGTTNRLSAA
jgi:hypothetical protein